MINNNCCEKCGAEFSTKFNYERHVNRKTPCVPEEKEKYDLDKKSCYYCSKVLATVYSCQNHMKHCKFKPNDEIEELKQIVAELSKKIQNSEKKPKKII